MAKKKNIENEIGIVGTDYGFASGGSDGGFKAPDDPLAVFARDKYKWQKEMVYNDPFIGAIFKMVTILGSKIEQKTKTKGTSKKDLKARDLIHNILFDDMSHSFREFLSFVLGSEYAYGFALNEIIYKKRKDGYYGIHKLSRRLAPTIDSWDTDDKNNIKGVYQRNPKNQEIIYIPYDKLLHFKIEDIINSSPEGMSLSRNCFPAYYTKKYIEEQERVRIKKDARGMTIIRMPAAILRSKDADQKAFVETVKKGAANLSNSNDSFAILPAGDLWGIETLKIDGSLIADSDKLIERCDKYIAVSQLSDFMLFGATKGSSGNAQTKVQIFASFVGSLIDGVFDGINKQLIPQLVELNNLKVDNMPYLEHSNLSELLNMTAALALQSAGQWINSITNVDQYNYIMKRFISSGFPESTDEEFKRVQENNDRNFVNDETNAGNNQNKDKQADDSE